MSSSQNSAMPKLGGGVLKNMEENDIFKPQKIPFLEVWVSNFEVSLWKWSVSDDLGINFNVNVKNFKFLHLDGREL